MPRTRGSVPRSRPCGPSTRGRARPIRPRPGARTTTSPPPPPIWEEGYLTGELRGEVYADVPPALKRWRAQGRETCIFSSGSVLAQRLLFAHTNQGDLSGFIREYFDTAVGAKKAPSSYARIAAALGVVPDGILFISDVVAELDAASSAGMQTLLCARAGPAEATPPACDHLVITTFDQVFP
ncbi:MAG: acireductone synthase [Acidobacteria bacterium]|nr:MAG: acireductone synthase [Acidobacteriota bacterium]